MKKFISDFSVSITVFLLISLGFTSQFFMYHHFSDAGKDILALVMVAGMLMHIGAFIPAMFISISLGFLKRNIRLSK